MLTNLSISGYRTFRDLKVAPLARVNLFVGPNNAGKTSVLEATELAVIGTAAALFRSPIRRGERIIENLESGIVSREVDISHLFYGHSPRIGASFSIRESGSPHRSVSCQIIEGEPGKDSASLFPEELLNEQQELLLDAVNPSGLSLHFKGQHEERSIPLSLNGGVTDRGRRLAINPASETVATVNFIGTEQLDSFRLGKLWDAVVLTPEEEGIAEALRIIEPQIERIAFLSEPRQPSSIFLKFRNSEQRLPLGSLGDGLKRILALALNLSSARGGFLLVDEIDTGLHYTVMEDMWRLVIESSKRLNMQVLATTHSYDCVRALARVKLKDPDITSEVMLHRVEKNTSTTIAYNMDELTTAARSQLEVR